MTVQEKAKMLMSLIAHNERMCLTLREKPMGVTNYTEALQHGLYCMAQVHGLDEPLVAWMARPWYYDEHADLPAWAARVSPERADAGQRSGRMDERRGRLSGSDRGSHSVRGKGVRNAV